MRKTCLLLLLIASVSTTVHAQVGFEGGVTLSNLAIKAAGDKVKTKFLVGEMIGMFADFRLGEGGHIYFEPGAFYQTNGATITASPNYKYIINTANFPLYIEYKSGEKCTQRFFFGVGPYIGDNLSTSTGNSDNDDLENLDLGIAVNLGYIGKKHWYARVHYQEGLINVLQAGTAQNSIKESGAGLTIGYMIRGCRSRGWGTGASSGEGNHWRGLKKNRWSRKQRFRKPKGPAYY